MARKLTVELMDGTIWWLYSDMIAEVGFRGHHNAPYPVVRLIDSTELLISRDQSVSSLMEFWRERIYLN